MARKKSPELTFQQHIADFLVREHGYGVLEQADITDTEHFIAEDQLWAFLTATQADTLTKLRDDYGTDARTEVFKALRKALEHTPLWMLLRHELTVRGLELRLYYPKPRSTESAATGKHGENRITFRPHFYFGETNQEIDFVVFLNGLPIVALELKHEKNQTVHDAVAQFAARDHTRKIFQHPFLYLAADTSDVMAATDSRREQNFRWHNTGLTNVSVTTDGSEYPVEFLRVVLIGLIDRSPVHPREVFADALSDRASAVIVAHNHPSAGVEPSQSDINITAQLKAAGEIVGIELLDHIIFNRTRYFSFLEDGKL
jgi:type I restriction enzyme R subunit